MRYTSNYYTSLPRKDWGGTLTGASSGFKLGSSIGGVFGPVGSGIAGGIGALVGGIFGNSASNRNKRKLLAQERELALAKNKAKTKEEEIYKTSVFNADRNYLNTLDLNNINSLYMKKGGWIQKATKSIEERGTKGVCSGSKFGSSSCPPGSKRYNLAKTFRKMARNRAEGGQVSAEGINLSDGDKLLTKNGSTSGSHETGQNLPIKKKGRIVAIAEPGEVLVNDSAMPYTPFVLSKRIGRNGKNGLSFAKEYMILENSKTSNNANMITSKQAELIRLNNAVTSKSPMAAKGLSIGMSPISVGNVTKPLSPSLPGIQSYKGTIGSGKKTFGNKALGTLSQLAGSDSFNTMVSAAGTLGNILMTNRTINKQREFVKDNLKEALGYNPRLSKNYLLNENVNVSDVTSDINQGYMTSISGLSGLDPAIASALKNSANLSRINSLQKVYGEANRSRIGLRNQNIAGIAETSRANTDLQNQTSLMKLNAKITANEQLGELEGARLSNFQGAISELNSILHDKSALDSIKARYKDTIGTDFMKKCGGKIGKRKRKVVY